MNRSSPTVFSSAASEAAASNGNVERIIGQEWIVDAFDCPPERLVNLDCLRALLDSLIADFGLQPLAPSVWHQFPDPGGVTGMYLLAESHLTCHTWPEHGVVAINLFCCRPRPIGDWQKRLKDSLGAIHVEVRCLDRAERRETRP